MNFLEKARNYEKDILKDLQELLQIDSVIRLDLENKQAPFGKGIRESLDFCLKKGEDFGFKVKNVENVAGHIEFGKGEELIGVLTHVDVVPAVGKWTYPPFSGTIVDGKIYARGSVDDKGPTIASLYALKILKDSGVDLNSRVRLIIGTDEETAWRCMDTYFKNEEMPTLGFSPDASFPVIYGEKGIMSIDLISKEASDFTFESGVAYNVVPEEATVKLAVNLDEEFKNYLKENNFTGEIKDSYKLFGLSAHAMEPEKGVNAAINLSKFLNKYINNNVIKFISEKLNDTRFKTLGLDFSDPVMKDLTVNLAIVEITEAGAKVGLNLRYPTNWNKAEFLEKLKAEASKFNLEVVLKTDQVPHFIPEDDYLVRTLHNAYIKYSGDQETKNFTIGGGTYARALNKGVAFGMVFPGREDVVHQVDEHAYIEDIIKATAIYAEAIYNLGK